MTDLPEHETHEDQLLLDAIDGDEASRATVAADPRLSALFEAMTANRSALVADEPSVDPAMKATALAAAMSVFDDMQASVAGAEAAAAALVRKRRSLRLFRSAGAVAASAAVVVGIVAIAPNLSTGGSDGSTAGDTASATTAAPAATTAAASAAPQASRAEGATVDTTAAPATTNAPTSAADSFAATTTTTVVTESAEVAADAPQDAEAPPVVDARLLECAELASVATSDWITSTDVVPQPGTGPYVQVAVMLADGLEIVVTYDPDTCDVNSITEPAPPGEGGQ